MPSNHHERTSRLHNFATVLIQRFERLGSIDDIIRTVAICEENIALTSDRAVYLAHLGLAFNKRSQRTGSMDNLNNAISAEERAVDSTSSQDPALPMRLNNLGASLYRRFEQTGDIETLECAITKYLEA